MKIIYLIPESGYSTDLRSDTLWGMLCWGIRHLYGGKELGNFIDRANRGQPDFVISSSFPFKQHGTERIRFFPNPLILPPENDASKFENPLLESRARKALKEVEFLGLEDFEAALHGKMTSEDLLVRIRAAMELKNMAYRENIEYFPSGQTIRRTAPERRPQSQTHNTIDRLKGGTLNIDDAEGQPSGQLFHAEEIFWVDSDNESDATRPNTGIFFLADGPNIEKIEPILSFFRDFGFGADRTAGKGFFDFEIEDFTLPEPPDEESNAVLNLSLFHPTLAEITELENSDSCLQYLLEKREGFVGGYREGRRKQPRIYFKEGSVFARPAGKKSRHMGCINEQSFEETQNPGHKVWENGFAFMVNLNWKK